MIDRELKRCLGQMMKGVQVVAATHGGVTRAYCSHWVCQVSFEEPILMASVSPKHDTHPLLRDAGRFAVSILACEVEDAIVGRYDHDLFFARVVAFGEGRLGEPPLLYSSRLGWRMTGEPARERGDSIRDRLLARLDASDPLEEAGD